MKKLALLFALVAFAPLANAATADTGSFDFWAWVESLFEFDEASIEVVSVPQASLANIDTALSLGPR